MQRHQADLGAVTYQQEDKRQLEYGGFELTLDLVEMRPQQRRTAFAQHTLGGKIQQNGAKQGQRDTHATQDEIFPRRFKTGRGAIQADQQNSGERGRFHRHPDDAHVIGGEGDQHGEGEQLIHAVIQMQHGSRELAVMLFDAHVGAREQRGGEGHEGGQCDQKHIELVYKKFLMECDLGPEINDPHG